MLTVKGLILILSNYDENLEVKIETSDGEEVEMDSLDIYEFKSDGYKRVLLYTDN